MEPWPEGRAADPKAARERYNADLKGDRQAIREVIRADLPAAHFGLGAVLVASVLVGCLAGPVAGALVTGAFATLFALTLAVMFLRGIRGTDALRRAYLFSFGWGGWL
ncbi:hypothetical protein ABZ721_19095 [Streptomyces sp. NPDC006733]|uniref:hypothetical protein n=1 Tax=Streptomyces sp. NPDC006733 TaxID=3155460 RepID=UPI003401CEB4